MGAGDDRGRLVLVDDSFLPLLCHPVYSRLFKPFVKDSAIFEHLGAKKTRGDDKYAQKLGEHVDHICSPHILSAGSYLRSVENTLAPQRDFLPILSKNKSQWRLLFIERDLQFANNL